MKISIFILIILISSQAISKPLYEVSKAEELFEQFISKYGKKYLHKVEYLERLSIFAKNLLAVNQLNSEDSEAEFGITQFSDLTEKEFQDKYLTSFGNHEATSQYFDELRSQQQTDNASSENLREFDWRQKGAVTPVMNQGPVGSCWSFSTADNIAGIWKNAGNQLEQLSREQLIDCCGNTNLNTGEAVCGVNGGWPYLAMEYVHSNGGLATNEAYPYCAGASRYSYCIPCPPENYFEEYCGPRPKRCNQKCQTDVQKTAKIDGWKPISQNEDQIASDLISNGPLSIVLNAKYLQLYQGGVLNPRSCQPDPTHAVTLVGYGVSDSGLQYWTIKNSWGAEWGEQGYFKLRRGHGTCGVNKYVVTAVIDSYNPKKFSQQDEIKQ